MTGRPGLLIITNMNEDKEYNKIYPKMEKRLLSIWGREVPNATAFFFLSNLFIFLIEG